MRPRPTRIYHITDVQNLASIVSDGALLCLNDLHERETPYYSIAYDDLQARRSRKHVGCGPGGTLHDYVPFHFGPRSPMLYTISRGNVAGRVQDSIVYLVSTVEAVHRAGLRYVFTDGHPIPAYTGFYDDLAHMTEVDWPLMKAKWWHYTQEDPDRPRRRQAEFLVHRRLPWELVDKIVVRSADIERLCYIVLRGQSHKPLVFVRRDWYY